MIVVGPADLVVRCVLWLLAAYHLAMGGIAVLAPSVASRVVRALYGAAVVESGQVRYMTSMIGALAIAIGGLAVVAALSPAANHSIVAALIVLMITRIFCRVRDRRLLAESFGVSGRRNMAAIALLAAESAILLLGLR